METCPCGSNQSYDDCCGSLINGQSQAATAEALMRSRYTAFVKTKIDYISATLAPSKRQDFNRQEATAWSKNSQWQGLEIIKTENGGVDDDTGTVEFIARFTEKEKPVAHHELAEFEKIDGRWYFVDGQKPKSIPTVRQTAKIGRNDPCSCGSGKKYKKCCGV